MIEVDQSARPYFRYGNGKWGRALYQVNISSAVSGETRNFKVYALPNPPELHAPGFQRSMLVPILIGMDHLGQHGASMMIDFTTGLALKKMIPVHISFDRTTRDTMFWTLGSISPRVSTTHKVTPTFSSKGVPVA